MYWHTADTVLRAPKRANGWWQRAGSITQQFVSKGHKRCCVWIKPVAERNTAVGTERAKSDLHQASSVVRQDIAR